MVPIILVILVLRYQILNTHGDRQSPIIFDTDQVSGEINRHVLHLKIKRRHRCQRPVEAAAQDVAKSGPGVLAEYLSQVSIVSGSYLNIVTSVIKASAGK